MKRSFETIVCFFGLFALGVAFVSLAMGQPPRGERGEQRTERQRPPKGDFAEKAIPPEVAALSRLSLVLGCPTDKSEVASILSAENIDGYIEYGTSSGKYTNKTDTVSISAGKPINIVLNKLLPNTQYFYRLNCKKKQGDSPLVLPEYSFHTQRTPGSTFSFSIQGDSHPERPQQNNPELYARTLLNAASGHPDFYLTIGDDFSVDTLKTINAETVTHRYILQRPFLGLVANSSPIFLVNGNHEQAVMCNLDGTPNNVAVWAQNARNLYYPQPAPDSFYTGDKEPVKFIGQLNRLTMFLAEATNEEICGLSLSATLNINGSNRL
jgi:hypothetical protein